MLSSYIPFTVKGVKHAFFRIDVSHYYRHPNNLACHSFQVPFSPSFDFNGVKDEYLIFGSLYFRCLKVTEKNWKCTKPSLAFLTGLAANLLRLQGITANLKMKSIWFNLFKIRKGKYSFICIIKVLQNYLPVLQNDKLLLKFQHKNKSKSLQSQQYKAHSCCV